MSKPKSLRNIIKTNSELKLITYFNTPQAEASAKLLSEVYNIPLTEPLSFLPLSLGVAEGKSHKDLFMIDSDSAFSLDLFRNRAIDVRKLWIKNSEPMDSFEKRMIDWWGSEGKMVCNNKIIVGSNSTLIMLTNLLEGNLPFSNKYMCYGIPNGSYRIWRYINQSWQTTPEINNSKWPQNINKQIGINGFGHIMATYFYPGWGIKKASCIIAPGYFGNSRHGPYSLYVRLARALALEGFQTYTFDYLGSGESSPISRSFSTEIKSIQALIDKISQEQKIFVIGHCSGAAVVSEICHKNNNISGIALAPLVSLESLSKSFFSKEQVQALKRNYFVERKGITISLDYLRMTRASWKRGAKKLLNIVIAEKDQYDTERWSLQYSGNVPISCINEADHNFSISKTSNQLIKKIVDIVKSQFI